jgi:hypothetical protein
MNQLLSSISYNTQGTIVYSRVDPRGQPGGGAASGSVLTLHGNGAASGSVLTLHGNDAASGRYLPSMEMGRPLTRHSPYKLAVWGRAPYPPTTPYIRPGDPFRSL